jgi:hypothetical protein
MNKRFLTIGAAVLALGVAGVAAVYADPPPPGAPRAERHHPFGEIDANNDGFVSRAEAQAQTERMFDHMDTNHDGKLDSTDRGRMEHRIVERRVIRKDGDAKGKEEVEEDVIIEHGGPGDGERRVIVRKHGDGPRGHHRGGRHHMGPPMGMMMFMHSSEADANGDGALSKQEMVAQHLRFFDAADVNGDGRIKFEPPPEPPVPAVAPTAPAPPAPPTPPAPPRR